MNSSLSGQDVVALAHAVRESSDFEHQLVEHLQRAIGFDAAILDSKRATRSPTLVGVDPERFRVTPIARFAAYDRELAPVKQRAFEERGVAMDTTVLGVSATRRCAYYRDFVAPVGGKHSLLAYARVRGREVGWLMFGRTGSEFRAGDLALVEHLLPTIALALSSFPGMTPSLIRDSIAAVGLTPRESEVLTYLCQGFTNAEIALACGSSPNTVRNQLTRVFEKLGATTRAEAVAIALRQAGS